MLLFLGLRGCGQAEVILRCIETSILTVREGLEISFVIDERLVLVRSYLFEEW